MKIANERFIIETYGIQDNGKELTWEELCDLINKLYEENKLLKSVKTIDSIISELKIENDCLKFKLESTKKLLQKIKDYCDDIGMIIDGYKSDAERYWSCFILVFIYSEL